MGRDAAGQAGGRGEVTEAGTRGAAGPRRARGQMVVLTEVIPWDASRLFVDVSDARAIGRINQTDAATAHDRSGLWGNGFVAGPLMAAEVGRSARSPAVTAICREGLVWQISAYGDVNGAGAVCFPIDPFAERTAKLVGLAASALDLAGYDGRIVVHIRIAGADKSCIMTMPGYRFWLELPRTGAAGHPLNYPFNSRPCGVKEAAGGRGNPAGEAVGKMRDAYVRHGRVVRDGGYPL